MVSWSRQDYIKAQYQVLYYCHSAGGTTYINYVRLPSRSYHDDDFELVSETLQGLKWRLEAWKGALESKGQRVNVKKTKMVISSENVVKVTMEGMFSHVVLRKGVGSSFILGKKIERGQQV